MASFRNFLGLPVKLWDSRAAGQVLQLSIDKEHWEFGMDGAGAADAALASANAYTDAGLAGKEPTITAGTAAQYWRGDKTWQALNSAAVGLSNVNNTSDASKPVSAPQAAADSLRVLKAGDTMTGPLVLPGDPSSALQAATKQYTDARAANPSPISKTAAAEVFLTAAGGETSAQLTIDGVALAGTPTVSAIHRTDWQGRQLLYSTARTNLCPDSNPTGASWDWNILAGTVSKSGTTINGGPYSYFTVQRSGASSNQGYLRCALPLFAVSAGDVLRQRFYLRAGNAGQVDVGFYYNGSPAWASSGNFSVSIISGPGSIGSSSGSLKAVSGLSATQDTLIEVTRTVTTETGSSAFWLMFYPGGYSGTTGTSVLLGAVMASKNQSLAAVLIPTSGGQVTVTDYTLSGSNVALGQAASAGAVYDWDGSGAPRYPASFAGPVTVGQYLKAALPSASTYTYALIVVTDATGGPALCLSNGTNWINIRTGSAVS